MLCSNTHTYNANEKYFMDLHVLKAWGNLHM
jgi:hypothetical protein